MNFDAGAGHSLRAVRVFGRATFILSVTKRKTHFSGVRVWGIFGCSFFGQAILGLFRFPFQHVAQKKDPKRPIDQYKKEEKRIFWKKQVRAGGVNSEEIARRRRSEK